MADPVWPTPLGTLVALTFNAPGRRRDVASVCAHRHARVGERAASVLALEKQISDGVTQREQEPGDREAPAHPTASRRTQPPPAMRAPGHSNAFLQLHTGSTRRSRFSSQGRVAANACDSAWKAG